MSTNIALAKIFDEIAAALEITGAMVFKVNANRNVARVLEHLTVDVATLANDKKKLTAIEGIGDGSAKKIIEYVQTGKVTEHEELLTSVPRGVLEMTRISGIGPKTAKLMWEKAGVTDLTTLKDRVADGSLKEIPRLGEKTIQNIAQSLEFMNKATERMRLGEALPLAESIVEFLQGIKGVTQIAYAGSLRRGQETIGDIDILASTDDPKTLADTFASMPLVKQVLVNGETKVSVRIAPPHSVQADLRIIPAASFGAALMYFTGSKQHNIVLRERALKKGLTLNEYGLFADEDDPTPPQHRGAKPKAAKTEESIYKALGLPFVPPELREDRGEFAAAAAKALPELISLEDIKAELHSHTTASDGSFSIEELANEAKRRGFHTIAVTDHSKSSVQANGLSADRLLKHIDAVREVAGRVKGITILAGAEVDILIDGRLDYDDNLLAKLDFIVASPHASLKQDSATATKRLLAALRHPLVHILGHPTGRIINRREGLSLDINQLIEAAIKHDKALEINANHLRLDLRDSHVRAAVEAGALIAIDTDAHTHDDFDELRYGVLTGRRGWLMAKQCINAWPKAKLHKWIKAKR